MNSQTTVIWRTRDVPLDPVGVAARGAAAVVVARRLLDGSDEMLATLTGVCGDGFVILLGDGANLPWADGVIYLGRDPSAPALLAPTTHAPSVPVSLLTNAMALQFPEVKPPFSLIPDWLALVSLASARAVAREPLACWLAREEAHRLEPEEPR